MVADGNAPKGYDTIQALALCRNESATMLQDHLRPGSVDWQRPRGGISMTSPVHIFPSLLVLGVTCTLSSGQPEQAAQGEVPKLIGQLTAKDFRTRQKASDQLEKLGAPVLPALRKALKTDVDRKPGGASSKSLAGSRQGY